MLQIRKIAITALLASVALLVSVTMATAGKSVKNAPIGPVAQLGIAADDSLTILPDSTIDDKPWGLVTLSVGNMRRDGRHSSEMVSQVLMGTPVKLLQYKNGWYFIESPAGYPGWIDEAAIVPLSGAALAGWKGSNRYFYNRVSGLVYANADNNSPVVSDLVLGNLFIVTGEKDGFFQISFPDKRTGFVHKSECISYSAWAGSPPDVNKIITTACNLKGGTYLWGGTSTKATDCSGLVKLAYFAGGLIIARDASQQALCGDNLPLTGTVGLVPGDLLFFGNSNNEITHVAMYMGAGKYIHSAGMVKINSLNPGDTDFQPVNRKRLVAASRIINSINKNGVVLVKEHPWYN